MKDDRATDAVFPRYSNGKPPAHSAQDHLPMPRPQPPATFSTSLSSVPTHHIGVECVCGHAALIPVAPALDRLGPSATVKDLLDRVRCHQCNARQIMQARIVFVGASDVAMQGATDTDVLLPRGGHPES